MVTQAIGGMVKKSNKSSTLSLETCEYLNISVCPIISESKDQVFNVVLFALTNKMCSSLRSLCIIQEGIKIIR